MSAALRPSRDPNDLAVALLVGLLSLRGNLEPDLKGRSETSSESLVLNLARADAEWTGRLPRPAERVLA